MAEHPVIVNQNGGPAAGIGLAIIVIVAILIAIFVWHPWIGSTSGAHTATTSATVPHGATGGK